MLRQKTCEVPFGITAILIRFDVSVLCRQAAAPAAIETETIRQSVPVFMRCVLDRGWQKGHEGHESEATKVTKAKPRRSRKRSPRSHEDHEREATKVTKI